MPDGKPNMVPQIAYTVAKSPKPNVQSSGKGLKKPIKQPAQPRKCNCCSANGHNNLMYCPKIKTLIPSVKNTNLSYIPKSVCKLCLSTVQGDGTNCSHKEPGCLTYYKKWMCNKTGMFSGFCTHCDHHDKGKEWIRKHFKVEDGYKN